MSDLSHQPTVQVPDHALREAEMPGGTRRWLLERVAVGAAGVAAAGAVDPAVAFAKGGHNPIEQFGTVAVTTEAFTVTLLTELLRRVSVNSASVPAAVQSVFDGAYAAEVDHFRFTRKFWHPTTTTFWIPDAFWGGSGNTLNLTNVGMALVAGETLFVDLYLIGVTAFARVGNQKFARFCAELAGCESEHRVLAETLLNANPPNNVGFEAFSIQHPAGIESALNQAGVGFGVQGATPGAFYQLAHPIMTPPVMINSNTPS